MYREAIASFAHRRVISANDRDRREGGKAKKANRKLCLSWRPGDTRRRTYRVSLLRRRCAPVSRDSFASRRWQGNGRGSISLAVKTGIYRFVTEGLLPVKGASGHGNRFPGVWLAPVRASHPPLLTPPVVTDYELSRRSEKIRRNPQLSPTAKEFAICTCNTLISETCSKSSTKSKDKFSKFIKHGHRLSNLSPLSMSREIEWNRQAVKRI